MLTRGFGLIGRAPVPVIGLSALIYALPATVFDAAAMRAGVVLGGSAGLPVLIARYAGDWALSLVLAALVQGAIARAALARAEGRRIGIAASLAGALAMLPALVALALVMAMGVALGLVLLVLPGLWLLVTWAPAASALVAERLGPVAALRRSFALVAGARWAILALLVLISVIEWAINGAVSAALLFGGVRAASGLGRDPSTAWALSMVATRTADVAVQASMHAALYLELREAREGPIASRLQAIFA